MTLKPCTCCKKMLTTKNSKFEGRQDFDGTDMLWFTCSLCRSTIVLVEREPKRKTLRLPLLYAGS